MINVQLVYIRIILNHHIIEIMIMIAYRMLYHIISLYNNNLRQQNSKLLHFNDMIRFWVKFSLSIYF